MEFIFIFGCINLGSTSHVHWVHKHWLAVVSLIARSLISMCPTPSQEHAYYEDGDPIALLSLGHFSRPFPRRQFLSRFPSSFSRITNSFLLPVQDNPNSFNFSFSSMTVRSLAYLTLVSSILNSFSR